MKTTAVVVLIIAFGSVSASAEDSAGPPPTSGSRVEPSGAASSDNLDARFAQILIQLTSDRLQRAKSANTEVPGTVSADDLALIQRELDAFVQLDNDTKNGGKLNWFKMLLDMAEASRSSADSDWRRISALPETTQGFARLNRDMVRLRAELADVNLERGKAAASGSADEKQNWALQYVFVQMQEVRDRVRVLEERE
jgi:hypothetical protein